MLRAALNLFHTFSPFTGLSNHYDLNDALTGGGFCADDANDVVATMFEMSKTPHPPPSTLTPGGKALRNGSSCKAGNLEGLAATDALMTTETRSTTLSTTAIKYRIENTQKCASK